MRAWQLSAIICCSLVCFHAAPAAGKIILKGNGVGGWSFSTDGTTFHDAGFFGGALRQEMNNSQDAIKRMNSYKANRWAASITALSAVTFYSCAAVKFFKSNPGTYAYSHASHGSINTLISLGTIAVFICAICQFSADHQLKAAVKSFNGSGTTQIGLTLSPQVATSGSHLKVAAVVSF